MTEIDPRVSVHVPAEPREGAAWRRAVRATGFASVLKSKTKKTAEHMSRAGSGGVLPCSVLVLGMEGAGKSQLIRHIRRECGRRLLVSEDLRGLLAV